MAKNWSTTWNRPKHWRLRATATDGLTVTLGRYETEEEAHADSARFAADATYCDLEVQALAPKPPPANEGAPT